MFNFSVVVVVSILLVVSSQKKRDYKSGVDSVVVVAVEIRKIDNISVAIAYSAGKKILLTS